MLESMRNHAQSWMAKLILGGIALSFVLWGVGDYFLGGKIEPIATVDGKPVSAAEFSQAYERQLNAYRAMLGKQYSSELMASIGVKSSTLQTLINRRIMLDQAHKLGLAAPEAVVLATVHSDPNFQSASGFDVQRYHILTRNMGFSSAQDYENDLRLNIMVDALQRAIVDSVPVSEAEIRERFNQAYEQRVLAAIVVDPATQLDKVSVDEAQAKSWYEAHKQDYRSPLRIKAEAVVIDPRRLAEDIKVDDADLQKAFEERKADLAQPEERKARHILIKVASDATDVQRAAARKKIEAAQARIKAGEDFSAVAKAVSEDSSASEGGDLGWFKEGAMVAAFNDAVFSMDKGTVSDVVETPFGYHLIRLDDIRPAHEAVFDEVKDSLRLELLKSRSNEEAYKLSQDLDEAIGMEGSLRSAANSLNMKLVTSKSVSQEEAQDDPLLADPEIAAKAFSTLPGQAVEIIETRDGRYVALDVVERTEPDVLPYESVARRVMTDARLDAAANRARDIADEIRKSSGKSLDELAQAYGQAKYISKPLRSSGQGDSASWLTQSLLQASFAVGADAWVEKAVRIPQGFAAVHVQQVIPASEDEYNKQALRIRDEVAKSKGSARFARWLASVRDHYEIHVNAQELDRFK
ncbi:peptidyl-prolyl cis-trans isomerase [Mariprofundus erugo]|uniref:SurA N-terminal domain-containing protein n=1 Tax=Mariprofundus erugo TaxID=2528639 RepID=UPI0010FE59A8|nr:SurA N-terminal domain-containing protein [Mariprofundus erugo]TLS77866.1 peptidyl-prolyl cis-trans isomerase [Mariprofundus erugo]